MSFAITTGPVVSQAGVQAKPGRLLRRGGYCAVLAAAALAGACLTPGRDTAQAIAQAGWDWAHLLRGMAALKAFMAFAAAAGVFWRLGATTGAAWLAAYAAAGAIMMLGPGLIWGLWHIALGAALLHAGLFATLLLLWRDPQVGAQLAAIVAARRRLRAP